MTGKQAYEEDVRRRPLYDDGTPRKNWDDLPQWIKDSWHRDPTPRDHGKQSSGEQNG